SFGCVHFPASVIGAPKRRWKRSTSPPHGGSKGWACTRSPPWWRNTPECDNLGSVNNRLTVLAGQTAVGKGTISTYIRQNHPEVWFSVSATQRPRRPGEIDGVHYHLLSDDDLDALIPDGHHLEH